MLYLSLWGRLTEGDRQFWKQLDVRELESKLLKGGYIGDYKGEYHRGY